MMKQLTGVAGLQVHSLLRDYYKLDHEDEVGGVKTRFRYRQVPPIRDGLSTEEILSLPDRDLNSIIGLRKLAPYRDDTATVRAAV
jgi:protein KRI1